MTPDDSNRCRRCRKQITPQRTLCRTCEAIDMMPDDGVTVIPVVESVHIDPTGTVATVTFVADAAGGTAHDPCGGETDGGCGSADSGCCGGD